MALDFPLVDAHVHLWDLQGPIRYPWLTPPFSDGVVAGGARYLQFFFYTMGESQMGRYGFSSWTLHTSSIIIFAALWGLSLKEWRGASVRSRSLLALGLAVLVSSTVVIGLGNATAAHTT